MKQTEIELIKEKYFYQRNKKEKRNKKKNLTEYNDKFNKTQKIFSKSNYDKKIILTYLKNYNRNGYYIKNKKHKKITNSYFFKENLKEIINILKKFSNNKTDIFELGSGFGRIIFSLLFHEFNKFRKFYACDFNITGLKIINKISRKYKFNIKTIKYDFLNLKDLKFVKRNSIIFTYNSIMCIPNLKKSFFKLILKKKPKIVIHFEATYINKPKNTLEKLSKKYFNNCDYNKIFINQLIELKKENKINLKIIDRNFSSNILLNEKIIIWEPKII